MSPTTRAAVGFGLIALSALFVPPEVAILAAVALAGAVTADAFHVRPAPEVATAIPAILARGVPARLTVEPVWGRAGRIHLRQPAPPEIHIEPREADGSLEATVVGLRRGRHLVPATADYCEGPLGLGRWYHRRAGSSEVLVYPDLPAARRVSLAVRLGRFRDPGRLTRGPLGLGTDFESVRDYLPDDDIRQVNWAATARTGRPMSNQFRVEQDRDVICLIDSGRLMAAPIDGRTCLDAALDAVTAVALVADVVGDRCGVIVFDAEVRRQLRPQRAAGRAVVRAVFDLEPRDRDSDYGLAFRSVGGSKRSLILIFTDLLDEAAARSLVDAVPVLARRHAVVVATALDPAVSSLIRTPPQTPTDVYKAAAALDVLEARRRAAKALQRAGARVVEAAPDRLGAACTSAYLTAKARARL